MQKFKRSLFYFDWLNFFLVLLIAAIGLSLIYSATYSVEKPFSLFFKKQIIGTILGITLYLVCALCDYRTLLRWGYFAFFGTIALLIFTLIKGSIGMGAQRWINVGLFKLQPSELTKLFFPAFVAHYIKTHHDHYEDWRDYIPIMIVLAISFVLILKQPDLGTALIILFSGIILLWFAGLERKFFTYGAFLTILMAPALWYVLKPYQKNRIAVFMGYGTTQKERYQIEQAEIAIGSGGFLGKGFLQGTQNKLQFLPEGRTDFIFAVLCEEWGFVGASVLLLLYILLFGRILIQILTINQRAIQLLALGLLIHLLLSTVINIWMVLGLLPIVGIPLPLVSYGLSNLCISYISFGWLQGICMQEY